MEFCKFGWNIVVVFIFALSVSFVYSWFFLTACLPACLPFGDIQYETDDDGVVQKKLIDGKTAYVDSRYRERSFAEKKLIELMEKCWIYDPDERISMFEAVEFLRKAVKENKALGNKRWQ